MGAERPDTAVESHLSPAEAVIVRAILEGKSHPQIAESRRTSPRMMGA